MIRKNRSDVIIACVVAGSLLGDSFLYVGLPLQFEALGLNLVSVGILLSVNRLIRFFSNTWAGIIYNKYGIKRPFVVASALGTLVTFCYGLVYGFSPFFILRVLWGIAWSFLRLPGYLYVTVVPSVQRGKAMGIYQSISVVGSLGGTLMGGFFLDQVGFRFTVFVLAAGGTIGTLLSLLLHDVEVLDAGRQGVTSSRPRPMPARYLTRFFGDSRMLRVGLSTTMNNLLIQSILTSTISLYLFEQIGAGSVTLIGFTIGVATLSSILVAIRRISRLTVAPFISSLSDFLNRQTILFLVSVFGACSMMVLGITQSIQVIVLVVAFAFIASSSLGVILATVASDLAAQQINRLSVISSYANWVDIGSALGPLVAYLLRLGTSFRLIYLSASLLLLGITMFHYFISLKQER
ncbi:MAG: MFS transporter [Candidatus Bathyarchaeota archaeon]|nr:MFS transporter [Candidatus Bathyarchaeota archaeon]